MKRNLRFLVVTITALTIVFGCSTAHAQNSPTNNDEKALTKLIHEWADATVQGNTNDLEKIMTDNFHGSAEGILFNKRMLIEALKSGQLKVADLTIEDVRISIRGNSASATGRSTLTNTTYMGKDFSGKWVWTDRFVKQRDGSWQAISAQSRRIKG